MLVFLKNFLPIDRFLTSNEKLAYSHDEGFDISTTAVEFLMKSFANIRLIMTYIKFVLT